jgi:acetyl esterase/lipase
MTTRHLIDPEIIPLLEQFPGFEFAAETLPVIRELSSQRFDFLDPPPLAPEVRRIEGPGGVLEIYWFDSAPGSSDRAALLHIHGGGMIIGSAASMQHNPSAIAAWLGIPVASVEYRLAPDHPFPAPQEDCYAGLAWLAANAADLGIDPERIGIIGESAGGGLAAAVAQMARDLGTPRLAAQFLTYPMLDHRTGGGDCPYANAGTGEFVWTRASNCFGWEALRGDYLLDDTRKGWFSPIRADDLSGLPPTWIGVGALDLFLDEDIEYARRLAHARVPVELHVYPGAIHAFNAVADAAVTRAFNRDLRASITRLLGLAVPA